MAKRWLLVAAMVLACVLAVGCGIPQEEHDAVLSERDAAQAQVASLQSDLTEAESQIESLESDLTEAESQINTLEADLAAAESNLKVTKNDLTTTRNSLAEAQAELAIPDVPVLVSPISLDVFGNYPRTTSLEWSPSHGSKPITYVIEVEYTWVGVFSEFGRWLEGDYGLAWTGQTTGTESTFDFVGAQPGRWRVKATNSYGESNWSEWRYFRYTLQHPQSSIPSCAQAYFSL